MREENQHSIQFGLKAWMIAECLSRGGANYEDLLSCWRESIFIILPSAESYATSGASDLYVKPKGPGGDAVCSFGDNLQQNNSIVWVQNIEPAFRKRDRQKLSFSERIASERCKDLMHR